MPILGTIILAALPLLCGPAALACSAAVAVISSAVVAGLTSGSLGLALRTGAIAAVTALAFNVVGGITGHTPAFASPAHAANIAGHAAVGCLSSAASGGSCGSGAAAGAVGSLGAPLIRDAFPNAQGDAGHFAGGLASSAALGGLASVAGGGKFQNGAETAAFGYLFNEFGAIYRRSAGELSVRDLDTGETAKGKLFSGTGPKNEVPLGVYDILERGGGGPEQFRLEPWDNAYGDDYTDTGTGLLRLHGPGRSFGCITACNLDN
ncbi:MAG: DUF637 domain-containing protein [Hyphomicrobiaceae bacterium]|nr:DUF637 domain-containing protein [Hyphomicrobiaceae bacterium]